jgi:hypothetical protein
MKEITIPTENRPGELASITGLLAQKAINIKSLDAMEENDHGFIIINVDEYDKALQTLRGAGYQPVTEDAIVIRVADEPGALARVANRFQKAHINLRSLHIIRRCKNINHVSLVSDNNEAAKHLVEDLLVK